MRPSHTNTITVPAVGSTTPGIVATAANAPLRVLVRNAGPILCWVAHETENLANPGGPSTGVYRIPAGDEDIFVLAPNQSIYSVGAGPGGVLAIAASEAFPVVLDKQE
jgi:hypothetical protein